MNIAQSFFPTASSFDNVIAANSVVGSGNKMTAQSGSFFQFFSSLTTEGEQAPSLYTLLENMLAMMALLSEQGEEKVAVESVTKDEPNPELQVDLVDQDRLTEYFGQLEVILELLGNERSDLSSDQLLEQLEQLYQQFLLVPNLPLLSETSLTGNQVVLDTDVRPDLASTLARWNVILQVLLQQQQKSAVQTGMISDSLAQQAQRVIAELNHTPDWQLYLKNKVNQEMSLEVLNKPTETEKTIKVPSFLPVSMLKQPAEAQAAPVLAQQEATPVSHQGTASTGLLADAEVGILGQQGKAGEAVPVNKTQEAIPQQTVRFSHLTEDLQQVMKQHLQLKAGQEGTQIRLKIHPEHLGQLDIRLTSVEGKIMAQLMTTSQMAKDALELSVGQLRIALQQQGLQVDRIEITQQQSLQQSWQEQREGQAFAQQQQQNNAKGQVIYQEEEQHFEDLLEGQDMEQQSIDFKA